MIQMNENVKYMIAEQHAKRILELEGNNWHDFTEDYQLDVIDVLIDLIERATE